MYLVVFWGQWNRAPRFLNKSFLNDTLECTFINRKNQLDIDISQVRQVSIASSAFLRLVSANTPNERRMAACGLRVLQNDQFCSYVVYSWLMEGKCVSVNAFNGGQKLVVLCSACEKVCCSSPFEDAACVVCGQGW